MIRRYWTFFYQRSANGILFIASLNIETLSNEPILTIYFSETVKRTRKYSRHSSVSLLVISYSNEFIPLRLYNTLCNSFRAKIFSRIAAKWSFRWTYENWALMKNETDQKIISHENMNLSGLNSDGFREKWEFECF